MKSVKSFPYLYIAIDRYTSSRHLPLFSRVGKLTSHHRNRATMTVGLPAGYRLLDGTPGIPDYLALRRTTGLSPKTEEQARAGVAGSWYACHIIEEETGKAVAMGRVIGDGGWYFHIIDMAVLENHQRRGLGTVVLTTMLDRIRSSAPPGAYVNLIGSYSGRKLYRKYGFVETAPDNVGMELRMPYTSDSWPTSS
ncbi:acyl-CoA N-acyltransferase [Xylogone sp. PMI_703]|nr:acyl-CoA N-acyltransferase [Xylogone sp. PMI_703]